MANPKRKTSKITVNKLKKKVWQVFSQYIRLKYATKLGKLKCYTCGKVLSWQEAQCGHGIGGRNNTILFDEELCRPQCLRCNIFLGGNYDVFHSKLIAEKGLKWFQQKLKQKTHIKQFTITELENLLNYYQSKLKQLKEKK